MGHLLWVLSQLNRIPHLLFIDVYVALGGGEVGMSSELLQHPHAHSFASKLSDEATPPTMAACSLNATCLVNAVEQLAHGVG